MASVYEAVHVGLGKRVAIKVMQPHLAANETTAARFVREGRAVAKVRHAHVVDVFDVGSHEGVPYLVMELLEGTDLAEYLKCHGRLGLLETIDILLPVCSAVAAAHEAGIVHRDLKPANVFLSRGRHGRVHPKVVDFGISTFMEKDGDLDLTHTQTMLGTVRYMSPEQTRGAKYADARSDQYSLAVMLYLCTTGEVPFSGEGVYETIHAIRNARLVPPSKKNPALPADFDDVVERALARDPNARFPSVVELGRALLAFATRRSSAGWEREFPFPDEDVMTTRPDVAPPTVSTSVPSVHANEPTVMTSVTQAANLRADRGRRARMLAVIGLGTVGVVASGLLAFALSAKPSGAVRAAGRAQADPAVTLAPPEEQPAAAPEPVQAPGPALGQAPAPGPALAPPPAPARAPSHAPVSRPRRPAPAPAPPPAATGNNGAPILE
jgi:serine/threonine-protein kinase